MAPSVGSAASNSGSTASNSPIGGTEQDPDVEFDCLVIGAGVSGLGAACALAKAGRSVAVLEARPRTGGRVCSLHSSDCELPIELGAEFIHGRSPELLHLVSQSGKNFFELDGQFLCARNGRLEDCGNNDVFSILRELPEEPDMSFAEWIAQRRDLPTVLRSVTSYVEGFNAADARVIGTRSLAVQQRAEDEIGGDRLFRLEEGYSAIAEFMVEELRAAGGHLSLAAAVRRIEWSPGSVRVETVRLDAPGPGASEGNPGLSAPSVRRQWRGRQCIITLPLGVLQGGDVRFDPPPRLALDAADRLAMGCARRIVLVFRERFWAVNYPQASFFLLRDPLPPTWWTPAPKAAPMLTGWIGGPRANDPAIATGPNLLCAGLTTLAHTFSLSVEQLRGRLLSWHTHNWQTDPFSRGAYSYVPSGALEALHALTKPVENTLFFAGEHTDVTGHWGTVHGALRSGHRAAAQVNASLSTASA